MSARCATGRETMRFSGLAAKTRAARNAPVGSRMKGNDVKPWLKVVLILAAIGVAVAAMLVYESSREAKMTAEAEATVTKVTLIKDQESSSLDSTEIRYAFDAKGAPTESMDSLPGDHVEGYTIGQKIRICYNPDEPADTNVRTGDDKCGA
jgi:hypothetical protein